MSQITTEQYRELARTEPWRSRWMMLKPKPFGNRVTDEQRHLTIYSRMYDNAYKNTDCPSDKVIDDDDMFDGWMITESRKNEREKQVNRANEKLGGRHASSQEVFIMADSKQDIEDVESLNDFQSKMVKKQRAGFIKQKGEVAVSDLPDQRMEINRQAMDNYIKTVKGGKNG